MEKVRAAGKTMSKTTLKAALPFSTLAETTPEGTSVFPGRLVAASVTLAEVSLPLGRMLLGQNR